MSGQDPLQTIFLLGETNISVTNVVSVAICPFVTTRLDHTIRSGRILRMTRALSLMLSWPLLKTWKCTRATTTDVSNQPRVLVQRVGHTMKWKSIGRLQRRKNWVKLRSSHLTETFSTLKILKCSRTWWWGRTGTRSGKELTDLTLSLWTQARNNLWSTLAVWSIAWNRNSGNLRSNAEEKVDFLNVVKLSKKLFENFVILK